MKLKEFFINEIKDIGKVTPENVDDVYNKLSPEEKEMVDNEKENIDNRDNLLHSKFGRLFATPEELEQLDKEKEEKEKEELKKDKEESVDESKKSGVKTATDIAKEKGLTSTGWGNWADNKGKVVATTTGDEFKWIEGKEPESKKQKTEPKEELISKKQAKEIAKNQDVVKKKNDDEVKKIDKKKTENKTKWDKKDAYPTTISGKDKSLDQEIDTSKHKAFSEPLYKGNDSEFQENNADYKGNDLRLDNSYKQPKSITELIDSGKVPKREVQVLLRMINSQMLNDTEPPISYFTDGGPGGAGKIQAQCGELMTMCCTAMTKKQRDEFKQSIHDLIDKNKNSKMIVTKEWVNAAVNNADAIHARIESEFGVDDASTMITHTCWDVAHDTEALGLKDYKKNKGFSTDIFVKLQLPTGQKILNEVSLKKDGNVNFLNSSTGKFLSWDKNIPDDIKPEVYQNELSNNLKVSTTISDDRLSYIISSKNEKLKDKKSSSYELKKIMDTLKVKSLKDITGKSRAERKLLYVTMKADAELGNKLMEDKVNKIKTLSDEYSKRSIFAIKERPSLKKGMLNSIRDEFPLKGVSDGEETMAIGKSSVDKKVMSYIFGTSNWNEIQDKLEAVTDVEPPYLAYRVKGTKSIIPVAQLSIREDGVGYGGQFKFELKLHKAFFKKLQEANQQLYGINMKEDINYSGYVLVEDYDLKEKIYDDNVCISKLKQILESEIEEDD